MRASLLACLLVAGCHDWDRFTVPLPLQGDLSASDAAGCPYLPTAPEPIDPKCKIYTFGSGIAGLEPHASSLTSRVECGLLRVDVPAGGSHDLWWDNAGAFKLEEPAPVVGTIRVAARFHAPIPMTAPAGTQAVVGSYLRSDGLERYAGAMVESDTQPGGPHEHNFQFTLGPGPEEFKDTTRPVPFVVQDQYDVTLLLNTASGTTEFTINGDYSARAGVTLTEPVRAGIAIGNCCGGTSAPFTAYLDWMYTCTK